MASEILDCGEKLHISNFNIQSREDRWPGARHKYRYSDGEHVLRYGNTEYRDYTDDESWAGPPYIALWRMNLVALSQKHNLYFVASRDRIHVYLPRNLKQALPCQPDLILPLPKSEQSQRISGYIDPRHPHSVNHMILGNFGELEILLMACDDGDVIAFYTNQFQATLENPSRASRVCDANDIKPFFHENVGITAWGLAIHQRSRLIAVSSNHREVVIFAMATIGTNDTDELLSDLDNSKDFLPLREIALHKRPKSFRDRTRNFCIRIQLEEESSNIPTITFVSDGVGEAAKIIACDINGWAWLIDPWEGIEKATRHGSDRLGGYSGIDGGERSWGVVCLSPEHFRVAIDPLEAWNLPEEGGWICVDKRSEVNTLFVNVVIRDEVEVAMATGHSNDEHEKLDAVLLLDDVIDCDWDLEVNEKGIDGLNDSAVSGNILQQSKELYVAALEALRVNIGRRQPDATYHALDVERGDAASYQTAESESCDETPAQRFLAAVKSTSPSHCFAHRITAGYLRLEHLYNVGREYRLFGNWLFCFLRLSNRMRNLCRNGRGLKDTYHDYRSFYPDSHAVFEEIPAHDPNPLLLFRTYAQDVELTQPLAPSELPTRLVGPKLSQDDPILRRFNMVAHIPELNIILVGSQCGEVVVVVLTQLLDPNGLRDPFFTFRQEAVLPLPQHLEKYKLKMRPRTLLLGMTTSPIQSTIDVDNKELVGRRWRVILHYYDHTIVSYEIGWNSRGCLRFGDGDYIAG